MRLINVIREKAADEKGSFSVEAVLMFPMIVWAFMAMFVFFEGLRESNINVKAAYTVSDLLSRETDEIDQSYLDGMRDVYTWLSRSANPVSLRVTVVRFDDTNDQHVKVWSRGAGGAVELTQDDIDVTITPNIPIMADAATAIVVETWTTFTPLMDIGLVETDVYNLVVTSPRFTDQLMFDGINDGTGSEHNDGTDTDQSI